MCGETLLLIDMLGIIKAASLVPQLDRSRVWLKQPKWSSICCRLVANTTKPRGLSNSSQHLFKKKELRAAAITPFVVWPVGEISRSTNLFPRRRLLVFIALIKGNKFDTNPLYLWLLKDQFIRFERSRWSSHWWQTNQQWKGPEQMFIQQHSFMNSGRH